MVIFIIEHWVEQRQGFSFRRNRVALSERTINVRIAHHNKQKVVYIWTQWKQMTVWIQWSLISYFRHLFFALIYVENFAYTNNWNNGIYKSNVLDIRINMEGLAGYNFWWASWRLGRCLCIIHHHTHSTVLFSNNIHFGPIIILWGLNDSLYENSVSWFKLQLDYMSVPGMEKVACLLKILLFNLLTAKLIKVLFKCTHAIFWSISISIWYNQQSGGSGVGGR